MTEQANDLLKKALELPVDERASLAGCLIDSLDKSADASAEEKWNDEIARRIHEIDAAKTNTIPWHDVRRRILSKLGDAE